MSIITDLHNSVKKTTHFPSGGTNTKAKQITVEPHYNEVLGTRTITLLYQVSHYIRVKKQRNIKSWDQQNYLVILLYSTSL